MTNLPSLTELAATRLKANAGRYQVVKVKGEWYPIESFWSRGVFYTNRQGVTDIAEPDASDVGNAARARDNTLDALEELADCHNIIGVLLRDRLAADEELTAAAELLITQLAQQLREAAVTLGRIRVRLPAAYLSDQYAVQRDEVTR